MRILLLGSDSAAGGMLESFLARWGRHEVETVTVAASRWKSERQAKKAVRRVAPDCIVDLRTVHLLSSGEPLQAVDVARTSWLAKACERKGCVYVLLSADRVFSGRLPHPYREQEAPDPSGSPGEELLATEACVRETTGRWVVLRVGPLFASIGEGLINNILPALIVGETLTLDDNDVFCPLSVADLARVIAGMLDQIGAGAEPWGIYHYASAEATSMYGFAEVVLAAASQYMDFAPGMIDRIPIAEGESARNWRLKCLELRDNFGIKQIPWRSAVSYCVREWFLHQAGD